MSTACAADTGLLMIKHLFLSLPFSHSFSCFLPDVLHLAALAHVTAVLHVLKLREEASKTTFQLCQSPGPEEGQVTTSLSNYHWYAINLQSV